MSLLLALLAGLLIGLSLGTVGGGGSILAVPVLVYGLGQSAFQATTGSLVVVGVSALLGAAVAHRAGNVLLLRGIGFGVAAAGGAVLGAHLSARVPERVLMAAFAALLVIVGVVMVNRLLRRGDADADLDRSLPILEWSPAFVCHCPRAARVLVTATGVGLLTGFLGVGGGFVVVPALVLALGMTVRNATGTSLVVIAVTSSVALVARLGVGTARPDWVLVAALTVASVLGTMLGARFAARLHPRTATMAFAGMVVCLAGWTLWQSVLPLALSS